MKILTNLLLFAALASLTRASVSFAEGITADTDKMQNNTITLTLKNGKIFTAKLEDNSSAKALMEVLRKRDISVHMQDYANMEKVGPLDINLPRNDTHTSTLPGDLILYQGRYLVIYYAPNTWNFTRLGRIENASQQNLISALGKGDIAVTLSTKR